MAGHTVLSCEAGAYAGGAYSTTWEKFLRTMGGAYAAGVNQTVVHGFSYATARRELAGLRRLHARTTEPPATASPGARGTRPGGTSRTCPATSAACTRCCRPAARASTSPSSGRPATPPPASAPPGSPRRASRSAGPTSSSAGRCSTCPAPRVSDGSWPRTDRRTRPCSSRATSSTAPRRPSPLADARRLLASPEPDCPSSCSAPGRAPYSRPASRPRRERPAARGPRASSLAQPRVRERRRQDRRPRRPRRLSGCAPDVRYATSSTLLNAHRVRRRRRLLLPLQRQARRDRQAARWRPSTTRSPCAARPPCTPFPTCSTRGRESPSRLARYTEDADGITLRVTLQPGRDHGRRPRPPGPLRRPQRQPAACRGQRAPTARSTPPAVWPSARRTAARTPPSSPGAVRPPPRSRPYPTPCLSTHGSSTSRTGTRGTGPTDTDVVRRTLVLDALVPWSQIAELADFRGHRPLPHHGDPARRLDLGHGAYLELGTVNDTSGSPSTGTA